MSFSSRALAAVATSAAVAALVVLPRPITVASFTFIAIATVETGSATVPQFSVIIALRAHGTFATGVAVIFILTHTVYRNTACRAIRALTTVFALVAVGAGALYRIPTDFATIAFAAWIISTIALIATRAYIFHIVVASHAEHALAAVLALIAVIAIARVLAQIPLFTTGASEYFTGAAV